MKKVLKWAAISIAVFVGGCTMITAGVSFGTSDQTRYDKPLSDKQVEHKQDKAMKAEKKADVPKVKTTNNKVDDLAKAKSEIQAYYDASTAGDFIYTYNHLTYDAQERYSQQEWIDLNIALGSQGADYLIANVITTAPKTYQVDLLVEGTYRTVYFVKDGNQYYHDPTNQEYLLYDGGLSSGTDSGGSAAASSPKATNESDVRVEVVISAANPVDVSVISMDSSVPMMEEQTSGKTFTFYANPNKDLTVSASDPEMDFDADDNISIKVYEDGALVAEDTDDMMAQISY